MIVFGPDVNIPVAHGLNQPGSEEFAAEGPHDVFAGDPESQGDRIGILDFIAELRVQGVRVAAGVNTVDRDLLPH